MRPLILLVDSDADTRAILRSYLQHRGFRTMDTGDGAEGLELAREHRPDLVIGDFPLDVPGHSPFITALRNEVKSDVPVLTLSARATEAEIAAARAVSQEVLTKPAPPLRVLEAAKRLLGERKSVP